MASTSAPPTDHPSSEWPPRSLCTVKVSAAETVLPIHASVRISAPASTVFRSILDTSTYPRWNSWAPAASINSQPGSSSQPESTCMLQKDSIFTLHVIMDTSKPKKVTDTMLRVTDISTPEQPSSYVSSTLLDSPTFTADLKKVYRIAWSTEGGWPGLRGERFHEMIILGEHECEVRTWECLGGMLAKTVRWFYGKTLQEKFRVWLGDLKEGCEGNYPAHVMSGSKESPTQPGREQAV